MQEDTSLSVFKLERNPVGPAAPADIVKSYAEGDWELALKMSRESLEADLKTESKLNLHTIQATSLYHLGRYKEALASASIVTDMSRLLPDSAVKYQAMVIQARIYHKLFGKSEGHRCAHKMVCEARGCDQLSINVLLLFARLKIDFCRFEEVSCKNWQTAANHLAGLDSRFVGLHFVEKKVYFDVLSRKVIDLSNRYDQHVEPENGRVLTIKG